MGNALGCAGPAGGAAGGGGEGRRRGGGAAAAGGGPGPRAVHGHLRQPQLAAAPRRLQGPPRDRRLAAGERSRRERQEHIRTDGADASVSFRALGGCPDAAGLQMQCVEGGRSERPDGAACGGGRRARKVRPAAAGGRGRWRRWRQGPCRSIDRRARYIFRYVNRVASGGVTALHLAALHGHVDCVHLLIDEHAALGAQTLPIAAAPMAAIGAGSTPLHYAASGGEVKCCQILVSRGADRMAANCNGWLAVDVARMWNCNWLEHVLSPKSHLTVPKFPPSAYLSLPLPSLLAIAADHATVRPCKGRGRQPRGRLLRLPGEILQRRRRSVRSRAVPEVRTGPVHGDEGLRGARARRHHPVPALPERHRLL